MCGGGFCYTGAITAIMTHNVSVIIPAYNEEATIGQVIDSVKGHPSVAEIIVVDDGSGDGTSAVAASRGVTLITLPENKGKAYAMGEGVARASSEVLLFVDADIRGFTHQHITGIIAPVIQGSYDMYVGVRARRTVAFNKYFYLFPILGGERAVTKALWARVPTDYKKGFMIEIALNYTSKKSGKGMGFERMDGVTQTIKEKKYGIVVGFIRRLGMIWDIILISSNLYIVGSVRNFFTGTRDVS
jgi:polyprenyl-phospho-N-acetylgalactosaminyl synthase